jgi:hypothetical protein
MMSLVLGPAVPPLRTAAPAADTDSQVHPHPLNRAGGSIVIGFH